MTAPLATDEALPEISNDYRQGVSLAVDYEEWRLWRFPSSDLPQMGGWVCPCQGDADTRQKTFVFGFKRQEFGDSGAAYLHYSPEQGFLGYVECS